MLFSLSLLAGLAAVAATNVIHPNGADNLCLHADKISVGGTISM